MEVFNAERRWHRTTPWRTWGGTRYGERGKAGTGHGHGRRHAPSRRPRGQLRMSLVRGNGPTSDRRPLLSGGVSPMWDEYGATVKNRQ